MSVRAWPKKHAVYSLPCMICKYATIRNSNPNLGAEGAVSQFIVVKRWATLETGMKILKIMSLRPKVLPTKLRTS